MTLGLIAGWKKWLGRAQGTLPAHSGLSIWCLWPRRKWSHKKAVPEATDAQPEPILESPDSPHEGHPNPEGLQSLSSSLCLTLTSPKFRWTREPLHSKSEGKG